MAFYQKHLFICINQKDAGRKCCAMAEPGQYFTYLKQKLKAEGLHGPNKVRVTRSGCLGRCSEGPSIVIYPDGIWYHYKNQADIDEIIEKHLKLGQVVEHLQMPKSKPNVVK